MTALTRWVILTCTLHRQPFRSFIPCSQYILESITFLLGREPFLKWKGSLPFIWIWSKANWRKSHCLKYLHFKRSSLLYFHIAKRPSQVIFFFFLIKKRSVLKDKFIYFNLINPLFYSTNIYFVPTVCQEITLGLKYNFHLHRVYILERKTEKEWAKTREGDRRGKWKKSLSGRGTMESKDHEVRNKRSRILEQKQSACLMEDRWEQRSKQELYWQRPGTLKSRVWIFLRQWGATGISIMWVTQSNWKVTCSINLPIDKNLVFIVMYNH